MDCLFVPCIELEYLEKGEVTFNIKHIIILWILFFLNGMYFYDIIYIYLFFTEMDVLVV